MVGDEHLRLAQRRSQARFLWFDEQPVPDTGMNTLSESLWRPLLSAESSAEPEVALHKLALLHRDENSVSGASVAGILLCTQNPERWLSNATITATRYRGKDQTFGQVDAKEIKCPLNEQVSEAINFVVRNMRIAARKDPARIDMPEYSVRALFEAIVNAVAHRDYAVKESRVRILMFDDRLEIHSPGGLPNNLTVDSMALRQSTRNEAITSVLSHLPVNGTQGSKDRLYFMERRGDGVPIILNETGKLCGKSPEYRMINNSHLVLTIPAALLQFHSTSIIFSVQTSEGKLLPHVDILCLFPDYDWVRAKTDETGCAQVNLYATHLPLTVYVAAHGHSAYVQRNWFPHERELAVTLNNLDNGGSIILPEGTGQLPKMRGSIDVVRDRLDRITAYTSNMIINEGKQQPIICKLGEILHVTDSMGARTSVRIVDVIARVAIIEYSVC